MPASWSDLFDRGGAYDVTLEDVRETADELSATADEAEEDDDA